MEKSIPKYYHIPPVLIKNLVARMDILIISEHADGTRWILLCPGNYILTMPSMTRPYNINTNDNNNHHYKSLMVLLSLLPTMIQSSLLLVNTLHTLPS